MDNNSPPCNTDTWLGNQFGTVNESCINYHNAVVSGGGATSAAPIRQPVRPGGRGTI